MRSTPPSATCWAARSACSFVARLARRSREAVAGGEQRRPTVRCTVSRVLDHVALNVTDYERSRAFYLQALAPLGVGIVMEFPDAKGLGLGEHGMPYLWICERGVPSTSTHVAL